MANLISISQMCDSHYEVLLSKDKCQIFYLEQNTMIHGIRTFDNCYGIHSTNDLICHSAIMSNVDLWHQRLGHINFKDLAKVAKKELV